MAQSSRGLLMGLIVAALIATVWAVGPTAPNSPKPLIPTTTPVTSPSTAKAHRDPGPPIPREDLLAMYQRELGDKWKPAEADRLLAVHALLERYFEASTNVERTALVKEIRAVNLDPNTIGRITRLRMHWRALEGGGIFYINERVGPHDVKYFFGVPKNYDRTKPWPLLIKLPTADAFMTDPPPDGEKVAEIYTKWITEELEQHPDAVVMMPLLNMSELYGPSYAGMNTVYQPMLHVAGRANIDPARVYLLGHAMAAHATWNIGLHFTTYFAGIAPLAGGAKADWQRLRIVNLKNVLPVVWHDAQDQVIKVDSSRDIVRLLRTQKLDVDYEETKGIGHAPDAATYARVYGKLRARVRNLYPPEVSIQTNRPDTMFNRNDWVQIWQPINPGKEKTAFPRYGTGKMVLYENTCRVDAVHNKPNRFEFTTQNVDSFRLHLNDQLIDFNRAVTIMLNKRAIYEGPIQPDVETMLKDQLFIGRGWRYYTAGFDIDVVQHPKPATRPATRPVVPATKPSGKIILGPG